MEGKVQVYGARRAVHGLFRGVSFMPACCRSSHLGFPQTLGFLRGSRTYCWVMVLGLEGLSDPEPLVRAKRRESLTPKLRVPCPT